MRRRLLIALLLAPLLAILLSALLALTWLREPSTNSNAPPPTTPSKEAGQPDDILLEPSPSYALALGAWITKIPLPLPSDAQMEELAKKNPIAFLKYCIRRYDYTVQGYELTFKKQERLGGKLYPSETIAVKFREEPFSVYFDWIKGERLAKKVLYVRGENNNKLLVKPAGKLAALVVSVVERDPNGEEAKESSRYPMPEFGIKVGMVLTLEAWQAARKNKTLDIEYAGVKKIKELGDRECYVLKRPHYAKPEADGISSSTFYFDKETWLQTGSTLKNKDGELIGEYWFADITLNPKFKPGTFTRDALK
jgi:hypothetical protein